MNRCVRLPDSEVREVLERPLRLHISATSPVQFYNGHFELLSDSGVRVSVAFKLERGKGTLLIS